MAAFVIDASADNRFEAHASRHQTPWNSCVSVPLDELDAKIWQGLASSEPSGARSLKLGYRICIGQRDADVVKTINETLLSL